MEQTDFGPWHFSPDFTQCIIPLFLFSISALWHIRLLIKYRQKFFIPFVIGVIFQIIGFAIRIICTSNLNSLGLFISQTLFILLAPLFYLTSMYTLLGKLIEFNQAESVMPLKPSILTSIFVTFNVMSFLLQTIGCSIQSTRTISTINTGITLVLIGFCIQLISLICFMWLVLFFDRRALNLTQNINKGNWRFLLLILVVSSILILVRTVYRIVEYAEGYNSYMMNQEIYFFILDSFPMIIVQFLYNGFHPGKILVEPERHAIETTATTRTTLDIEAKLPLPQI